jgi:hypothetical protein
MNLNDTLHDATLMRIIVSWGEGEATFSFQTTVDNKPNESPLEQGSNRHDQDFSVQPSSLCVLHLVATGLRQLVCPRLHPWGPSGSVNRVTECGTSVSQTPNLSPKNICELRIEMQSGDEIVVCAQAFRWVPSAPSRPEPAEKLQ